MTSTVSTLSVVALVVAIVAGGFVIWGIIEVVKAARSARQLADDLDARVVPLLDKADVTVDAANAELYRIDGILTDVEGVVGRFSSTAETVSDVVSAPVNVVTNVADHVRGAWRRHRREAAGRRRPHRSQAALEAVYEDGQGPSVIPEDAGGYEPDTDIIASEATDETAEAVDDQSAGAEEA